MFATIQSIPTLLSNVVNRTAVTAGGNETVAGFDPSLVLPGLFESLIPGYSPIRRIVLELAGFDISVFVPVIGLLLALHAGATYAFYYIRNTVEDHCTCAVDIDEYSDVYDALMRWLNENRYFRKSRYLRVAGHWWERLTEQPGQEFRISQSTQEDNEAPSGRTPLFNTNTRTPAGFEPDEGKIYFWYRKRPFSVYFYFKELKHRETNFKKVRLSCFGFSPQPLKTLIKEAERQDVEEEYITEFYRPDPDDNYWKRLDTKPARPLDTVTLEMGQKTNVVRDINDFIRPARKRWYASRGIPYRRGYLFSGPPGTGKTSLSLALAGVFSLSLRAVSIQDPSMSDSRLTELFDDLPSQCIVLLEDIDSAGIDRDQGTGSDENDNDEANRNNHKPPRKQNRSKVTLAGLLNAIDGVASHEGHILIMTTNYPEKLDSALKRPGRVDLHIEFTLATKFQAREIFLRMYIDEEPISEPDVTSLKAESAKSVAPQEKKPQNQTFARRPKTIEEACRERRLLAEGQYCPFMPFAELCELADTFVDAVPDLTLSPAEVQGYLLLHKDDPHAAARGVALWVEQTVEQKRLKDTTTAILNEEIINSDPIDQSKKLLPNGIH